MNRSLKIFVACALGAGIGTLVALQLQSYLWWLGLVVGGLVGYFSYEFKEVPKTISMVWRSEEARKIFWGTIAIISFLTSALLTSYMMALMIIKTDINTYEPTSAPEVILVGSFFGFLITFWTIVATNAKRALLEYPGEMAKVKIAALLLSPFAVFTYWPIWILWKAAQKTVRSVPLILSAIAKGLPLVISFLQMVIIQIHSELRLLCMVGTAIGAGIGYFTSNVLIGALAGGIIGVAHFEIFSKRVLRLVPKR